MTLRKFVNRVPFFRIIADYFRSKFRSFPGSLDYWEHRYSSGEDSGAGSRGRLAAFKANTINSILKEHKIESVIEFGCGDGSQLSLIDYPKYVGLDVSQTAIEQCKKKFSLDNSKEFFVTDQIYYQKRLNLPQLDLSISLDVIYHLVEDEIFHYYMLALFESSKKYVLIYSTNYDEIQKYHIKPRNFTKWIDKHASHWKLVRKIENPYPYNPANPDNTSLPDFYFYERLYE
jgi:cyclopropane fatty-acyl-phospholipid synthase-like methyltransferase